MDFLGACARDAPIEEIAHCLRISQRSFTIEELLHTKLPHVKSPDTPEAHQCRLVAMEAKWALPHVPAYPRGGPDPACTSGHRVDPAVILGVIQLLNTRTFEGVSLAMRLVYAAVKLTGPLKIQARGDTCEVACTNTKELLLHNWILTPAFDNEPPHFVPPTTQQLPISHLALCLGHEIGHILRSSTEAGADTLPIDWFIAAACVIGDLQALMQMIHAKFRNGDYELNRVDELQNTPLCIAADEGHALLVAFLIRVGADPNYSNGAGQAPLQLAQRNGHNSVLMVLKKHVR